ncbi:hypothetical protein ILUMI_09237 [Ignelater luminosus]|uniref:CRAL-TRIO domain-containing protein n=1 Tax=Ignelater luminosus TaxID=2038154 RepID=A0A8K0D5F4_IGNLU|nr:hypothetical protein ILUMI_09237 [Ignelater luminosus]
MSSLELLQYSELEREKILKIYGRTPQNICQDIDSIKEWLEKQPHLPEIPDNKIIENFLLMNKFKIEKVKQKIDMYYSIRTLIPEFFDKNPNSPAIQKIMNSIYVLPLPKLTNGLHRVFIAGKIIDQDPDNLDCTDYLAFLYNQIEMRLRHDCNLAMIYVYDLLNLKSGHLLKFTPTLIKKMAFIGDKVFTTKLEAVHVINAPPFLDSFMSFFKGFLKPKLADRIFIHKNMDTFYEMIPKEILPKDYGGQEKSLDELRDEWQKLFLKYDPLYKHLQTLKVNEELRTGKPIESDILGIQGNFRKLDID